MRRILPSLLVIFLLIIMQLPFMTADPDTLVDINTRGAWTDEGLYTSQARNFINGYGFEIQENTTAIRGPLQVGLQIPIMKVFGQRLWVLRTLTLILILISLWLIGCGQPILRIFLLLIGLLQFHIFQFSHYAMAEMGAVSFIIISAFFVAKMLESHATHRWWYLVLATFFLLAAVMMKVQYAYVMAILPLVVWVYTLMFRGMKEMKPWNLRIGSLVFPMIGIALFLALWVLPHRAVFQWVMDTETGGRFGETPALIYQIAHYNVRNSLWVPELIPLMLLSAASLVIWVTIVRRQETSLVIISLFALVWLLLEFHKLPMRYIPNRYLLSFFMAAALFCSSVLIMLWNKHPKWRPIITTLPVLIALWSMWFNYQAYDRRTHELIEANEYIKSTLPEDATVLGAWAPSLTWGMRVRTIPVWDTYAPDEDLVEKYHPTLVISEFNQADSDSAYIRRGIDLESRADSVWHFSLWRMDLEGYWMGTQKD